MPANTVKKAAVLILVLALILSLAGCKGETKEQSQIFAMDTVMLLTAYGNNAKSGLSSAASLINGLEVSLDPENENSEIFALNSNGSAEVSETVSISLISNSCSPGDPMVRVLEASNKTKAVIYV